MRRRAVDLKAGGARVSVIRRGGPCRFDSWPGDAMLKFHHH
jgi:hypothetical protein